MSATGKIVSCVDMAPICHYRCCDQDPPPEDGTVKDTEYILMFPGEYNPDDPNQSHLTPVGEHNGGVLARCAKECFDQASCHPDVNFKPLDCKSYPIMPKVVGGVLHLVKDTRCPLTADDIPPEHRAAILEQWEGAVGANFNVLGWLASLSLEGYEE